MYKLVICPRAGSWHLILILFFLPSHCSDGVLHGIRRDIHGIYRPWYFPRKGTYGTEGRFLTFVPYFFCAAEGGNNLPNCVEIGQKTSSDSQKQESKSKSLSSLTRS